MNKLSFLFFRIMLWLWDIISLNIILLIISVFVARAEALYHPEYPLFFLFFNLSWMAAVFLTSLYLSKNWLDFENFFKLTVRSYFLTALMVMVFIFIYHYLYSRLFIILCFVGFAAVLIVNRLLFHLMVNSLRSHFRLKKNVLILGYNEQSKRLIKYFLQEAKFVKVTGCFDETGHAPKNDLDFPFINSINDCMQFVKANNVREIYSTLAPERHPEIYELSQDAEKNFVHFKFVPDYHIFVNRNVYVDFVDDIPVLSLRKEPLEDTGNRIKKMAFDIAFSSLVILLLLSWLIPLLAILIKLDSRGPVFFVQLRSGKNNKPFRCIKLRSLQVNDEANTKQVSKDDKRITRLGRFMRKTNIDELPQFFNVLMGDMSVVGPRPHMLKHTEDFSFLSNGYMIRHFVKPGLTGWAQVNNLRGEIRDNKMLQKRIEYDTWYMENWSLWLDLKIVLLTLWTSVKGDSNAF